jgi:ABC-type spermidine/putrescine transport systems, ATPase components
MQAELRRVQRDIGTTFLYVTHDQDAAMSMSDRVGVMADGRILESGAPESLYDQPETAFVADFLGDANTLAGTVAAVADGSVTVAVGTGKIRAEPGGRSPTVDSQVMVMVRPEAVELGDGPLSATIRASEFKGFYHRYTVALGDDETSMVTVRTDANERFTVGDSVNMSMTDATLVAPGDGTTTAEESSEPTVASGVRVDDTTDGHDRNDDRVRGQLGERSARIRDE